MESANKVAEKWWKTLLVDGGFVQNSFDCSACMGRIERKDFLKKFLVVLWLITLFFIQEPLLQEG